MSDKPLTDLSYLEDMGMGDDLLIIEMIELFLNNTPETLRSMKKHETNGEWKKLSAEAHKLKPNLSYMGLDGAKEIILELEETIRTDTDLGAVSGMIREIEAICNQAYEELSARLSNLQK